jgi:hypothetical protein
LNEQGLREHHQMSVLVLIAAYIFLIAQKEIIQKSQSEIELKKN